MIVSTPRGPTVTRALRSTQGLIGVSVKRQFPAPPCALGYTLGYFVSSRTIRSSLTPVVAAVLRRVVADAVVAAVRRCVVADAVVAAVRENAASAPPRLRMNRPSRQTKRPVRRLPGGPRIPQDDLLTP